VRQLISVVLLVLVAGCGDPSFNKKYPDIIVGMTKQKVVKLMESAGEELDAQSIPVSPVFGGEGKPATLTPVVTGKRFLQWKKDSPSHRIIVGFDENDRVVSKWQWIPNL